MLQHPLVGYRFWLLEQDPVAFALL